MWAPVAQPQPQHVHPLPEWLANEVLESVSQGYNRGNVMVLEDPSFSPSFSFDDFIYYAILNSPIDAEFLP